MQTTVTTIIFDTIYVFQLIARMASLFAQLQGGVVLLLVNKLPRCVVVEQNQTLCRNSIKSGCFVRLLHSIYQLLQYSFQLSKTHVNTRRSIAPSHGRQNTYIVDETLRLFECMVLVFFKLGIVRYNRTYTFFHVKSHSGK